MGGEVFLVTLLCFQERGEFLPIKLLKTYQGTSRALFQSLPKPCYCWQLMMKIRQRNEMPISKQNIATFYYFVVVARRIMVNTRSQNLQNY